MVERVMEFLWRGTGRGSLRAGLGEGSVRAGPAVRPGLSLCEGKSLAGRSRPPSALLAPSPPSSSPLRAL